jgi:hypothetical protein
MTRPSDAGADSTARMLAESAVCLVRDVSLARTPGGMWTSCGDQFSSRESLEGRLP